MSRRDHRHDHHDAASAGTRSRASETPGRHGVPPAFQLSAELVVASSDPAPRLPTGIEGTPQQHEADHFLAIVRAELARWKTFRSNWRGELPGGPAFEAALSFGRGMGGHLDPSTGEIAPNSDGPMRQYLRRQLGPEELQVLQQMVGFLEGDTRRGALAEAFGVPPLHVVHTYRLVMQATHLRGNASRGAGGLGLEGGASAGISARVFAVIYTNNLGMTYRHSMQGLNASVGVGAAIGPTAPTGGTDTGLATEAELSTSESRPVTPGLFWAPEWFDGTYLVGNIKAGGELSAGRGNVGAGVTGTLGSFTRVTFRHESDSIDFEFTAGASVSGATASASGHVTPRLAATAGVDVGIGHAFGGQTHGSAPALHAPLRHPVKTGEMHLLMRGSIDFETESAAVSPAGELMLVQLVQAVRDYAARYPDSDFSTTVVADASPRWRGARSEAEANQLNEQLSAERARTTQGRLRAAVEQIIGASREHGQYRDEVAVQTRGSQDARVVHGAAMTDNSQQYRRVQVRIDASLYREGEP